MCLKILIAEIRFNPNLEAVADTSGMSKFQLQMSGQWNQQVSHRLLCVCMCVCVCADVCVCVYACVLVSV